MTTSDSPEFNSHLSSVWSRSCGAPIRVIFISQQGVVAVVTKASIFLYAGAPSFGVSHTLDVSPAQLTAYCFSADGTHFLTGDSSGFIKWWDVHNGDETAMTQFPAQNLDEAHEAKNAPPAISALTCSQESELVAAAADSFLCIYGHGGLKLYIVGPLQAQIQSIQWNMTNELAVNIGTAICMISITPEEFTLGQQYPAEIGEGMLNTLSCSPDGAMLAAGCSNGVIRIWDLASEKNGEISVFVKGLPNTTSTSTSASDGAPVQCLAWDSSGHFLSAAGDSDVIVWDMKDNKEDEGRDNSIVCYGHGQKAKITALKFQPHGSLLATGGDDCQVLVFDSNNFTANGVVSGLVSYVVSGKLTQHQQGSSITSLAWHPSGLLLAGTTLGVVDAFEVTGALRNREKVNDANNGRTTGRTFLITKPNQLKQLGSLQPSGWGGEPLITTRNDDSGSEKFIRKNKVNSNGHMNGGAGGGAGVGGISSRMPAGHRNKFVGGKFKSPSRPGFNDHATNVGPGNWHSTIMTPAMMHWPGYHQQMPPPPPFMTQQAGRVTTPYVAQTPNPPESNSNNGNIRGGQNTNVQHQPAHPHHQPAHPHHQPAHPHHQTLPAPGRNDRNTNRNMNISHPADHMGMPAGGHVNGANAAAPTGQQYPMGYMPYPPGYHMGYAPPSYGYYPMPGAVAAPGMHESMHAGVPMTENQHNGQHPQSAPTGMMNKPTSAVTSGGGGPTAGNPMCSTGHGDVNQEGGGGGATGGVVGVGSPEIDEDIGSKSSEATNNGVNNGMPLIVVPDGSTIVETEGTAGGTSGSRSTQAQTLYIGNLASGVEETLLLHYFAPFGPVMNIQVIRERDSQISRGFAFVTYAHPLYAHNAMQNMDSIQIPGPFEGRRLKVSFSNRR